VFVADGLLRDVSLGGAHMATSVLFEEQVEIPFVRSLADFRRWALSDEFPERGRIDYLAGRIEVDMSPGGLFSHGTLKAAIVGALWQIVKRGGLGHLLTDRTRISCPAADLSVEPDVVFISDEALDSGRVRLVPKATGQADRYVEAEGPPDLVVEIVSDTSVAKDTQRLPKKYHQAGVPEFWLIDARGETLVFTIYHAKVKAYRAVPSDAEGFQRSVVFTTRFRLTRRRNASRRWVFDLEEKPA
jgi:Uma2 family endonuclease